MFDRIAKIMLTLMLVSVLAGCGTRTEQLKTTPFVVEVENLNSMIVASLNKTGPHAGVGQAMKELLGWIGANKITPTGAPFALYYNVPGEVPDESLSWAVCIPVPENTGPDEKSLIKVITLPPMEVAFTIHSGGYENLPETYERLINWIEDEELITSGPALECYLSPVDAPSDSIKVKLGMVVQPMPESIDESGNEEGAGTGGN
ncbi:MAG: GyrI-like domain-containing protein [bacterium]